MEKINGYTIDQIKAGFAAMEHAAANSTIQSYTVDELIVALKEAASKSPNGGYGGGARDSSLVECVVVSNSADIGGGIQYGSANRSVLMHNTSNRSGGGAYRSCLANTVVAFNAATNTNTYGGGCYECTNVNCTVYGNLATSSGGGSYNCIATNCIFWGNSAPSASYPNVRKGVYVRCLSTETLEGMQNLRGNPLMYAPNAGDFRLCPGSPCLDAGTAVAGMGEYDLIGHLRVQGSAVDIGACEGSELTTLSTEIEVPYSWIDQYPALLEACAGDYEKAATLKTGKGFNSAGQELCVWHDYLVGTDPTDHDDKFRITDFKVMDGEIEIAWDPDLNENNTKSVRIYKLKGSNDLQTWYDADIDRLSFRFFKVAVEVPNTRVGHR